MSLGVEQEGSQAEVKIIESVLELGEKSVSVIMVSSSFASLSASPRSYTDQTFLFVDSSRRRLYSLFRRTHGWDSSRADLVQRLLEDSHPRARITQVFHVSLISPSIPSVVSLTLSPGRFLFHLQRNPSRQTTPRVRSRRPSICWKLRDSSSAGV